MVKPIPPERQFMINNLIVEQKNEKARAENSEIVKGIESALFLMGFTPTSPKIEIREYGFMPDGESDKDHRYWVTFSVDTKTTTEIQAQRRGITRRMATINMGKERKEFYLKFKKYRGFRYEAIHQTMRKAAKIFARTYSRQDGCEFRTERTRIVLYFDNIQNEIFSIETLIKDHLHVFNKAIKNVPENVRKYMLKLAEEILSSPEKRAESNGEESKTPEVSPEEEPSSEDVPSPEYDDSAPPDESPPKNPMRWLPHSPERVSEADPNPEVERLHASGSTEL